MAGRDPVPFRFAGFPDCIAECRMPDAGWWYRLIHLLHSVIQYMSSRRLGVAFIGSGFNTRFHLQAWRGVRDADVVGIWSPNAANAKSAADLARKLDIGQAKPYRSIGEMVADK